MMNDEHNSRDIEWRLVSRYPFILTDDSSAQTHASRRPHGLAPLSRPGAKFPDPPTDFDRSRPSRNIPIVPRFLHLSRIIMDRGLAMV